MKEVSENGTIDGTALTERYFPTLKRDVFISYSHKDQRLAYMVVGILEDFFGLKVFTDYIFWGSADKLLRNIDEKYCLQADGKAFDYKKRNFSTAHVHAMLTSAIMKAMDQAEIILFLNTPNSVDNVCNQIQQKKYDDRTLSPWIYEEVLLTTMLRETPWHTHRREWHTDENALMHFEKELKVSYKLPKDKLIQLDLDDIIRWYEKYEERKNRKTGRYGDLMLKPWEKEKHPLNILYELKCGVEQEDS